MGKIYQLKITLKDVKPPVWRRVEVPADIKLDKLGEI
ncbi:MAG: plasmid pRiA4b ORF-3 family protein, partial [Saprospiraceae bacterium]